ncbi:hypothetical protein FACS189461_3830 [Spirochaetia bacterium]|nr:hypothetical protein FACS189461_3830 [Spirochaetia bacterium]
MSKFEFTPYSGAGEIAFGLPRDAVRKLLGQFNEFKKSKFSKNTADNFKFCHIFYDLDNKIEAVEFFEETELIYKKKNLFSMSYNDFLGFIKDNSLNHNVDDSSVIVEDLGIAAYTPDKQRIESIIVYHRGYYD